MTKSFNTSHPSETSSSRRQLFKGAAGLGAVSLVSHATAAQTTPSSRQSSTALVNPRTLYPTSPFDAQQQTWPGLQSRMHPLPDCGEKSYVGHGQMKGRRVLITGGDSGIGRAVAIAYAREGADIAINYLPQEEEDARQVIALVRKEGRKAIALPGDLRDENFCQKLVDDAARHLIGLDTLVNCAGRQHYHTSILDLSTEEFDWTMKTNLYALLWLIKAALPHLPAGGVILNTSSSNAYEPWELLTDYAMSKAAISNMTRGLAKQLLPKGIRVNAVAPGPFWTPLQVCGSIPPEAVEHYGSRAPFGRPGQPVEIASTYVTLAATSGSYLTGQVWGITGGMGVPG